MELAVKEPNLKVELLKGFKKWKSENNYEEFVNLDSDEREGLKILRRTNQFVVSETDKSNKFSIDLLKNYKEGIEKFVENDKIIDEKEVNKVTKFINEAS